MHKAQDHAATGYRGRSTPKNPHFFVAALQPLQADWYGFLLAIGLWRTLILFRRNRLVSAKVALLAAGEEGGGRAGGAEIHRPPAAALDVCQGTLAYRVAEKRTGPAVESAGHHLGSTCMERRHETLENCG